MKESGIIERKVITIKDRATIREAAELMIKNKISGMPVIDKRGQLIGFISERDIIKAISIGDSVGRLAKDIMTKDVIAIDENASVEDASQLFHTHPIRYIPVIRRGKVVGIIARKDLIKTLLGQYY